MSGFVVRFGGPEESLVNTMMEKIRHRGPEHSGTVTSGKAVVAQNYLPAEKPNAEIPVGIDGVYVACDAQIGNLPWLREAHGLDADASAEELILKLYQRKGTDLLAELNDAIFGIVITDGERLFAARDLLGIKTVFYGYDDDQNLHLCTELKSLAEITDDINEFPAGHYMDETGKLTQYAKLQDYARKQFSEMSDDVDSIAHDVRDIIGRCIENTVDFSFATAGLLSGGMDSSVISYLAGKQYKEKYGKDAKLRTYAIGVGESSDIVNARLMAEHIGSEHIEVIVSLEEILDVLPTVIYCLEHFDPSLIRSAVANYMISRCAARDGYHILLSGEGGDEIFCGYLFLKDYPVEDLRDKQLDILGYLHANASLRLDRMNACNSIKVVAPLISGELLEYSMNRIHPKYKIYGSKGEKIEKWIFRKAFEGLLPDQITWRLKQEFSQGSGFASLLPLHFEDAVSDSEFTKAMERHPVIRSKEEMYYFNIFTSHFGAGKAVDTVGQWPLL